MDKLITWIGTNATLVKAAGGAVLGLVALVFVVVQLSKAIKNFGADKMKEGMKSVVNAIIIVILAAVGITGIISIANTLRPSTLDGSTDFSMSVPGDPGMYNSGMM